ncbi:hypothetical protein JCM3765_004464 [Sporobolomyces pararoseus]
MSNIPGSPLANSFHRRRESSKPTSIKSTNSSYDRDGIEIVTVGGQDGDQDGAVPLELLQSVYYSNPLSPPPDQTSFDTSITPTTGTHPRNSTPPIPNSPFAGTSASGSGSFSRHSREASVSSNYAPHQVADWPRAVSFTTRTTFPPVKKLSRQARRRILVTGGAGFVGSHLVDRLMFMGHDVVVLDNFFSGSKSTLAHWVGHPNFELVRGDVVEPHLIEVDEIYHLACPASPKAYQKNSIKTLKTSFIGTMNCLGLAKRVKAKFLLSSTSEVYGSPEVHPQPESYWGNVNSVGPRACYDEGKRVAEALTYGYHRQDGVDIRVARIFNCFGPRMSTDDGRLVSNFAVAALKGEPLEIYGDGQSTRSLMFVHDLISGLIALMGSNYSETPVNIGTTDEATVEHWARTILSIVNEMRQNGTIPPLPEGKKESEIIFVDKVVDDPPRRRPDTTLAKNVLNWEPRWTVRAGLEETIRYFVTVLEEGEH